MKNTMKNTKNDTLTLTDEHKKVMEKLTKKEIESMNFMNNEGKVKFLQSKIDSKTSNEIRIEKNDIGILIEIPNDSLLNTDFIEEKDFKKSFDLSGYGKYGKTTVKVKGSDNKIYGVQLTILEYK